MTFAGDHLGQRATARVVHVAYARAATRRGAPPRSAPGIRGRRQPNHARIHYPTRRGGCCCCTAHTGVDNGHYLARAAAGRKLVCDDDDDEPSGVAERGRRQNSNPAGPGYNC